MSLDDLNREQKRLLKRQGALDEKGAPARAPRQAARHERVGPAQYLRKVAWPNRPEVVRYSIIITATVIVYTAFIGGLDIGFQFVADWFYT